jgi:phosphocarrier protein HPr
MTKTPTESVERTVRIVNKFGLHARPAAEFVKAAGRFSADIFVRKDELEVNGKSIMGMMMLAAECGSEITIRADGADSETAVNELVGLVERRFGEE